VGNNGSCGELRENGGKTDGRRTGGRKRRANSVRFMLAFTDTAK